MGLYKNTNGVLSPIAGRGKAEYGASTVRTGTISFTAESAQWNRVNVTFDEPMPDADYLVDLIITSDEPSMGNCTPYMIPSKSATGFTFKMYCSAARGITIAYTVYKLYTDNEYNGLLNNQRYSTDEIDTGKTWIDGKPIYRLTFQFKAPSAVNSNTSYNLASYNIKQIISEDSRILRTDGTQESANWDYRNGDHNHCTYFTKSTGMFYFYVYTGSTTLNADIYVTIEYTKTTD